MVNMNPYLKKEREKRKRKGWGDGKEKGRQKGKRGEKEKGKREGREGEGREVGFLISRK